MAVRIKSSKDFYAGLMYIAIGGLAVFLARDYSIGSTSRMGPGYFPLLVGGLLLLIGLVVAARGFTLTTERIDRWQLKPLLLVLFSVAVFALTIERLGLAVAVLLVTVAGYMANPKARLLELIVLTVVLTAVSLGVFVYALKLPFNVWPQFR
ncbi:MAG: tripartite tricarboxylate transporter TctB family protein [Betaproteobacteria bacterium]